MRWVVMSISVTVMLAASEVSLTMAIKKLASVGNAVRMACGRMIRRMICK